MEEHPRCHLHKGGQIGFVLGQFTDGNNKKSEVVLHVIASFNYTEGDEEGKKESANVELRKQTWSDDYGWAAYKKEREALGRTAPDLFEIKSRRMYFEEETEMMKIYSARQVHELLTTYVGHVIIESLILSFSFNRLQPYSNCSSGPTQLSKSFV